MGFALVGFALVGFALVGFARDPGVKVPRAQLSLGARAQALPRLIDLGARVRARHEGVVMGVGQLGV